MFYKPDGVHFLFKKNTPRWICKIEEEDFENYELFNKIFGEKFLALTEPEYGFEKVIQKSKKQMKGIVFDNLIVRKSMA